MTNGTRYTTERAQRFEALKHEFVTTPDSTALAALVEQEPAMLDDDFIATVEGWLGDAERDGALDLAEGLRERLEVLHELIALRDPALTDALEAVAAARTDAELAELAEQTPLVLEERFLMLLEQLAEQASQSGDTHDATALRLRRDELQRLRALANPDTEALPAIDPQQAFERLSAADNQSDLLQLVAQAPFVLEEPFFKQVEQAINTAELAGDHTTCVRLQARLERLRTMRARFQITLPQTLEAFASVRDATELLALAQRVPFVLDDAFVAIVVQAIAELDENNQDIEANGLRARLDALRQLKQQRELADGSPVMQALITFLNAHTDDEARIIYSEQRELLDTDEAQRTLDHAFAGGDPESQERIEERSRLLQSLRSNG